MAEESTLTIPQMKPYTPGLMRFLLRVFTRSHLQGLENFPPPPYIITANHLSYWDSFVAGALCVHNVPVLTAKKYQGRLVGRLVNWLFAPVWIEQETPDRQALKTALQILKAGTSLAIAPEGTRSRDAKLKAGLEGAAYLIRKAQVPIVPVGIYGTEQVFRQLRPAVYGIVGRPYQLPKQGRKEGDLGADTERIMCAIAALLPPAYHGAYAGKPMIQEMATLVCP
jgi:1-acyl-sn-glycerol-3-phosphate acyltransferase